MFHSATENIEFTLYFYFSPEHWRCCVRTGEPRKQCPAKVFEIMTDAASTFVRNDKQHIHDKKANQKMKAIIEKECCNNAVDRVFQPVGQIIDEVHLDHLNPERIYPGLGKVMLIIYNLSMFTYFTVDASFYYDLKTVII